MKGFQALLHFSVDYPNPDTATYEPVPHRMADGQLYAPVGTTQAIYR